MTEATTRFRWRLVAGCAVLIGLAMTQSPGLLVPDTKLDLAIAPIDFLSRAAHLWDAEGAFGQLQNQAYGYLWPMGPFFVLGSLLDIDGWVVQRLWMALVMCVAFVGAAKVSRELGVRSDLACVVAGLAFAMSPRMLSVLGPSSIEMWPSALAPWVLLPLVIGAHRGSPRRAAGLSALAVAMVGGVNAAAASAVLPLGAVWLLTRSGGARRRVMMLWWPLFVLLGTLWWLVPLFLLGSYSPPFLDFIESAGVTTFPTTVMDALRGTSNWVPYVDAQSPAALDLLREYHLIINTGVVVVAGLAGLALARNPHRRFLLAGLFTGVFLVTMGHTGPAQGLFADSLKSLLDGALAPLRNVHKFDPVIRIPLVVGLAFTLEEALARFRTARTSAGHRADRVTAGVLVGSVVLTLVGASTPFALGTVAARNGFADVPGYWSEAAAWLAAEPDPGVALLVPGTSFGTYVWGEPRDEPMQALARSAWAVRNAVPLVPAGNIRMLDEIEESLAQGVGGAGLTSFLARAGISHIVVRNDLVRSEAVADPILVHQALDQSPGLELVADFGPETGGQPEVRSDLGRGLINGGWQSPFPAIEIYAVSGTAGFGTGVNAPTTVVGGPEDLLSAADVGVVGAEPTILAPDVDPTNPTVGPVLLTDGLRLVERNFGALHDSTSQTLSGDEPWTLPGVVHDYDLVDHDRWVTRSRLINARAITATSSRSNPASLGGSRPGEMPYAALDGDATTVWVSAPYPDEPQTWWVDFGADRDSREISVTLGRGTGPEQLRLSTPDWESPILEFEPGETRKIAGPESASRLRIDDVSGKANNDLSIAEVDVAGPAVVRELVLPELPSAWGSPDAVLLRRAGDGRDGCAEVAGAVRCRVNAAVVAEEPTGFRRRFSLPSDLELDVAMTVRPRGGPELAGLMQQDQPVSIAASVTALADPRASATAMIDGDAGTTWLAPAGEVHPVIDVNLLRRESIEGLAVAVEFGTAARVPQRFKLSWPGGSRFVELDDDGTAEFPPIVASRLRLEVQEAEPATDFSFRGAASDVPIGIGELLLDGVPYLPLALSIDAEDLGCGSGPALTVNGETFRTEVTASPAELLAEKSLSAFLCGPDRVSLSAGENTVAVAASDGFVADTVLLGTIDPTAAVPATGLIGATTQLFEPLESAYLATRENFNPGWSATMNGHALTPQVFDGWRQGWRVPGDAAVSVQFTPDRSYRWSLAGGLLAVITLLGAIVWPARKYVDVPALAEARGARLCWLLAVLMSSVVLMGYVGGAMGMLALVAVATVRRWRPRWEGWAFAGSLLPAVLVYALKPWGGSGWAGHDAWPHYLAVLALSAVGAWVAIAVLPRRERRMSGRSTTQ